MAAKIGYSRVSTDDQHPEVQEEKLRAAGCDRVFVDHGVSGKLASRPQFDAALEYMRSGDVLVIVRLDRAGRSVKHLIELAADLRDRGIGLQVVEQGLDTTTSAGRLFFHILSAMAEFEADLISERTIDGLATARAQGKVGGRRPKLDDRQRRQVRKMHADGEAIIDIAATFKVSRPTIYAVLEAEATNTVSLERDRSRSSRAPDDGPQYTPDGSYSPKLAGYRNWWRDQMAANARAAPRLDGDQA